MAFPRFVSQLAWLLQIALASRPSLRQKRDFIVEDVGERLSLPCFYEEGELWLYWYKQSLGRKPIVVSAFYTLHKKATFQGEFRDDRRFSLEPGRRQIHLKISDLRVSDSATYYCAGGKLSDFEFAEGTVVSVRGSGSKFQSGSETLECVASGDSGPCDKERCASWFRNSGQRRPGIVYTHGAGIAPTQTCDYSFAGNVPQSGTDLCAIVSCGQVLFGSQPKEEKPKEPGLTLACVLGGALAVTVTINVLLAISLYKTKKGIVCRCSAGSRASSAADRAVGEDGYEPQYAALNADVLRTSGRSREKNTTECVYSSVRLKN